MSGLKTLFTERLERSFTRFTIIAAPPLPLRRLSNDSPWARLCIITRTSLKVNLPLIYPKFYMRNADEIFYSLKHTERPL